MSPSKKDDPRPAHPGYEPTTPPPAPRAGQGVYGVPGTALPPPPPPVKPVQLPAAPAPPVIEEAAEPPAEPAVVVAQGARRQSKPDEDSPAVPPTPAATLTWGQLANEARKWSPLGVIGALVLLFYLLGGHEGIGKLTKSLTDAFSQANELKVEITKLREELKSTNTFLAAQKSEREQLQIRVNNVENNLSLVCDLTSEINLGKPHPSWCSADGRAIRFEPQPVNGVRIPTHITSVTWKTKPSEPERSRIDDAEN